MIYGDAYTPADYRDEPRNCEACDEQMFLPWDTYIDDYGNEMMPRVCKDCRFELGLEPTECYLRDLP